MAAGGRSGCAGAGAGDASRTNIEQAEKIPQRDERIEENTWPPFRRVRAPDAARLDSRWRRRG
jgi:hypothetical protein